jgi:hypothetical protein
MTATRATGSPFEDASFGPKFDRRTVNVSSALLSIFVVELLGIFCMGAYLLFR